jgi:peptidoglycan/LPS O-acetylase OafA/YrhL
MKSALVTSQRGPEHQPHIDGLRAYAVLAVVFYHFDQPAFSGGYVGVDVFFVISGYLITGLILGEIAETGQFGFRHFYARRVRRLFPALLVTLFISLICAMALFSPAQIQRFGYSLAASAMSVSNLYFWSEAGYFDVSSTLKPLLHTWSLAVEEQFYLLWPALLWIMARNRSRRASAYMLIALGLAGLGLNALWITGEFDAKSASTIFYLTPFRIHEFVIGGLGIFLAPFFKYRRWLQNIGMATGLGLMIWAVVTFNDATVFPGAVSLIPCIGALLVILSGGSPLLGWLLTNRLAVGCGLISYSIYLLHWPILVFYQYYTFRAPSQIEYAQLFLLTIGLSYLMYRFVENRFRRRTSPETDNRGQDRFIPASIGLMLTLCIAGSAIGLTKDLRWGKGGTLSPRAAEQGHARRFKLVEAGCTVLTLNDSSRCDLQRPVQLLLMGNSHEPDAYNAFYEIYRDNPQVNLISFGGINKCRLEFGQDGPSSPVSIRDCDRRFAILRNSAFVESLDGLVLGLNNPFGDQPLIGNKRSAWAIIAHLRVLHPELPLVVMGSYINTNRHCTELFNRFHTFDACKDPRFLASSGYGERESSTLPSASADDYLYIDKMRLFCPSGEVGSCTMEAHGEPAFYDDGHLSRGFARYLGQRIGDVYAAELVQRGFPAPTSAM